MPNSKIEYHLKDGTEVPGVTSVISRNLSWNKQALLWWAWNQGKEGKNFRETSEEAAQAGTVAHYLIDCDIKEQVPEIEKKFPDLSEGVKQGAMAGYLNFREWSSLVDFKPFLTEHILISEKFLFGGRIDCLGFIGKKLAIIDWKAAKAVYEDQVLQVVAYSKLWLEANPDKPLDGGLHILLMNKETAAFSHHVWSNPPDDAWQVFLHLLELEKLRKKIKKLI